MIMVSVVLKLFVSSRPLKLEGVLCIYILLFHEGQAKNHFYIFFHMIWTHLTFIVSLFMIFRLCFFSCYNLVAKFYCQDYISFAHVLNSLIPALNTLNRWSRLWWCMSPQKLFFCYHLPTWGRAGVKLGDAWYVSNVSIFFMLHACLHTICFVFCYTSWHSYAISRTNLLTRWKIISSLMCGFGN
jgi:hypothetical protein